MQTLILICLQFYAVSDALGSSQPVRYKTHRPVINPLTQSQDEMLDHAIFTKSVHWAYEEEWRLIQYKRRGAGVYKMPPELLVGVILGAQISEADRQDVLRWVDARHLATEVYQVAVSNVDFALEISKLRRT